MLTIMATYSTVSFHPKSLAYHWLNTTLLASLIKRLQYLFSKKRSKKCQEHTYKK